MSGEVRRTTVRGNETAYLSWGPDDGPLALLLHGFPDTPHSFAYVAEALAAAGYRVVAPWLRGYAPTALPADGHYQGGAYVADVLALRDQLAGTAPAVIVGHDIGAAVAYGCAAAEPSSWDRVVTLSLPPLAVLGGALASYPQLRRSWYTFLFQHPAAEHLVGPDFLENLWQEWSPDLDASGPLAHVVEALPTPDRVAAALGWYRAGFHPEADDPALAKEQAAMLQPTPEPWLYLHGAADGCIGAEVAQAVPGAVLLDGVGHFPHLEAPHEVARRLLAFLGESEAGQ